MASDPSTASVPAPRSVTLKPGAPPTALLQAAMLAKQMLPHRDGGVTLYEDKFRITDTAGETGVLPRRYTVTHSERTVEVFLSIGSEYDQTALRQPQTRERRDEVLAELTGGQQPQLSVTCLVSGEGLTGRAGNPDLRRRGFESEMPFVLAVIRYGDRFLFERQPELDQARISVEFRSSEPQFQARCDYGPIAAYRVNRIVGESRRLLFGAAAAVAALGVGALVYGKKRSR